MFDEIERADGDGQAPVEVAADTGTGEVRPNGTPSRRRRNGRRTAQGARSTQEPAASTETTDAAAEAAPDTGTPQAAPDSAPEPAAPTSRPRRAPARGRRRGTAATEASFDRAPSPPEISDFVAQAGVPVVPTPEALTEVAPEDVLAPATSEPEPIEAEVTPPTPVSESWRRRGRGRSLGNGGVVEQHAVVNGSQTTADALTSIGASQVEASSEIEPPSVPPPSPVTPAADSTAPVQPSVAQVSPPASHRVQQQRGPGQRTSPSRQVQQTPRPASGTPSTQQPAPAQLQPAATPALNLQAPGQPQTIEALVARQNVLLETLASQQQASMRALELSLTMLNRSSGGGDQAPTAKAFPRTAIFVDVPNVMYAADRLGAAIDFGKLRDYLSRDRDLVRASAYAPISDDPQLRLDVQRFVQPFVAHNYRIVTKPLKRFADGSMKANFDVELAIDVLIMSDRLDVISLVSGDGDFRRLVELVQGKGVRVEVVAFAASTSSELRTLADGYIDLTVHLHELV